MPEAKFIRSMFDDISGSYDLLNDVLSAGTHRLWKKRLVKEVLRSKPKSILDCATGTGDIAFLFEKAGVLAVSGLDFSSLMIDEARKRARKRKSPVTFSVGDVQELPHKDNSIDATTISFGIRNVEDIGRALKELSRVSRELYILEFGRPQNALFARTYFSLLRLYFPVFAAATRKDAYDYLIKSSETFPSGEEFLQLLRKNTDYGDVSFIPLFGGIAYIYTAKNKKRSP